MKKLNEILWGLVLAALGLIFGLNALGITDIDVFFDGWWTFFIIIPCLVGLFTERDKTGNIIGLLIGIALLLAAQDVFSFGIFWKLLIPAIIVIIGLRLIFGNIFKKEKLKNDGTNDGAEPRKAGKEHCATFSGANANYSGEVFEGATLTAVFGGVDCHLENAIIEKDVVINATAIFGGVDIYLPANVNVKVSSTSIFGGVSNKRKVAFNENAVTVYINGSGVFGGVDIK